MYDIPPISQTTPRPLNRQLPAVQRRQHPALETDNIPPFKQTTSQPFKLEDKYSQVTFRVKPPSSDKSQIYGLREIPNSLPDEAINVSVVLTGLYLDFWLFYIDTALGQWPSYMFT